MSRYQNVFILLLIMVAGTPLVAQNQKGQNVDSVLDQMEKQILKDESEGYGFSSLKATPEETANEDSSGRPRVKITNTHAVDFTEISAQIGKLEEEIERLAGDVQHAKQSAIVASKDNSYVYIETKLTSSQGNAIKSLVVKIDGFTVYNVRDTGGLLVPNASIPLYSGPLQAGSHNIIISANITQVQGAGLAVAGPSYKSVEKSFELKVPLGSTNKKYTLEILAPGSDEPTVKLNDSF